MKRAGLRSLTRLRPPLATTILLVVAACVVAGGAAACPGVASARTLARGIADPTLTQSISPADQATAVHAIRSELGATYVRFVISWATTEPTGPTVPTPYGAPIPYDPSSPYMTSVAAAITQAHADHLKVLITFQDVPKWASNPAYWGKSGYHANDALLPTAANLSYFSAFCRAVATQFRGQVYAYECWNEPNLYLSLYPQATSHDKNFGAHLYVQMLRSFSKASFPGLRVGWVVGPKPLLDRLRHAKEAADLHSDQLSQAVLLEFAESGRLEAHRKRLLEAGGIKEVVISAYGLREGLLYDLMGRFTDEDARVRSVRAMEMRYHVDGVQADRVEKTAVALLEQVESDWGLEDPLAESVLRWAARLHESGLDIAHSKYHRHSAYLLQHADMPGFPREEQLLLSALVGGHRRQLSFESLEDLLPPWDRHAEFLTVLLRLAVLLHRGRSPQPLPEVNLKVKGRTVNMGLPQGWMKEHPLTLEDLEQERQYLKDAGFRLNIV